jgi:hypothetical protein
MKVYIDQWLGNYDQFRIRTDVESATGYVKSMHPAYTKGSLRLCAKYAHIPDTYHSCDSTDEFTHFNLRCPASEAHRLVEVLKGNLSRFKGDIFITHDIDMPEPQVDNSQQQDDERHCAERLALTERD